MAGSSRRRQGPSGDWPSRSTRWFGTEKYAGIVEVTEYGVRGKCGDFKPLISEDLFYRAQAVLSGRVPSTTPQQRAPDFLLRFVRCESCGRGLTGSWSKGHRPTVRSAASRRPRPEPDFR